MKRLFLAMAACLAFFAAPTVSAATYSEVIVFVDSLVDSGNARQGAINLGLPVVPADPSLGYYKGRFSNGYTFADYLSGRYVTGQSTRAYLQGGLNFGVGGAAAALQSPPAQSPSFLEQLSLFAGTGHAIKTDSLIVLTFGGNDIRDALTDMGPVDFAASLADFRTGLQALIGAGARNILITGIPNIGALPATYLKALELGNPGIIPLAIGRSAFLNQQLAAIAADPLYAGIDLDFFDLYGLEQALRSDPAAFGLPPLETALPCMFAGSASCEGFLYFDPVHPTRQVHAAIADRIAQQLGLQAVPEPASWAMMIAGFALIGGLLRDRRTRLRFA